MEWYQSLARAPPVESCAQPATVIESYLYPSRTGRVAAQIGHTGAHGVRTVKVKIPVYHSHLELAYKLRSITLNGITISSDISLICDCVSTLQYTEL